MISSQDNQSGVSIWRWSSCGGSPHFHVNFPVDTWRNDNVIITSNDVATSLWRNNDVIIASCVGTYIYMCHTGLTPTVWQSQRCSLRTEGLWCTKRSYGNISSWHKRDPVGTWRNDTSLLRQNDVATSFWCDNDVIITSRVRWGSLCLMCVECTRVFVGLFICTSRPRQNGRRFVDGISTFILII